VAELPLFSNGVLARCVVELLRGPFPLGVAREESPVPVGPEPKPLPLEGDDSTAPLGASTALGADWTALPRVVSLLPSEPCAKALPDSATMNAAVVVIFLMDFIRLDSSKRRELSLALCRSVSHQSSLRDCTDGNSVTKVFRRAMLPITLKDLV
jgi:hypothetical protein